MKIGVLYESLIAALHAGWERVLRGSEMAGADGITVPMFALRLGKNLAQLQDELTTHTYTSGPLFGFDIPKPAGGFRRLAVPNVRDRVVQGAALEVLQPVFEQEFEAGSYAYRPGRSYKDAIRRLELLREEGFQWVVDADIHKYFDEVDHDLLIERVGALVPDEAVLHLVQQWIAADLVIDRKRIRRTKGLPQGSAISPILANLFLDELDEALLKDGYRFVRFADDFVVLCKSEKRAEKALALTEDVLEDLKLRLHEGKTRLTTFEQGFRFLGSLFVRSLVVPSKVKTKNVDAIAQTATANPASAQKNVNQPAPASMEKVPPRARLEETALGRALFRALDEEGVSLAEFVDAMDTKSPPPPGAGDEDEKEEAPETPPAAPEDNLYASAAAFRRTLYIQEQGSWLRMVKERFVVTDGKEYNNKLLSIPAIKVDQILVFGQCLITPAAMQHCLRKEIPITLLSSRGQYYGMLEATTAKNVSRQRLQFLRSLDEPHRRQTAIQIVYAKLYNSRSLIRRYARRLQQHEGLEKAARDLSRIMKNLPQATTLDQVRGYEGSGSAIYFGVFNVLLDTSDFSFSGRNRQPPRDPVNAMLSFGYTLLYYNIYALIRHHRMNPYVGNLHLERAGHPALASDLIEEFRFVIDRMVIALCNRRRLTTDDFTYAEGGSAGCFLNDGARKLFLKAFEQIMRKTLHQENGQSFTVRESIDIQIRKYARSLEDSTPYEPFIFR